MADELAMIIAGCRAGESLAQRRLYELYERTVYRLAARMVGRQEAADLTQEIFLRIFNGIRKYRGTAPLSTWIYRIAINECLRYRRKRSPVVWDEANGEPICESAGPERIVENVDLLDQALESLDEPLKAIFLLREMEELSYDQIAEVLGIPAGTVASQLNRARQKLQSFLRRVEQDH
jgi:RNA polymerase sigma-70 factor (ECF subfamily)